MRAFISVCRCDFTRSSGWSLSVSSKTARRTRNCYL